MWADVVGCLHAKKCILSTILIHLDSKILWNECTFFPKECMSSATQIIIFCDCRGEQCCQLLKSCLVGDTVWRRFLYLSITAASCISFDIPTALIPINPSLLFWLPSSTHNLFTIALASESPSDPRVLLYTKDTRGICALHYLGFI